MEKSYDLSSVAIVIMLRDDKIEIAKKRFLRLSLNVFARNKENILHIPNHRGATNV